MHAYPKIRDVNLDASYAATIQIYTFALSESNLSLIGCSMFVMKFTSKSCPVPAPAGGCTPHSGISLVPANVSSNTLPHGYSFFCSSSSKCVAQMSGVRTLSASMENCFCFDASNIGVSTLAGQRVVILTPVRGSVGFRLFTKPTRACFVAQYMGAAMFPTMPATDAYIASVPYGYQRLGITYNDTHTRPLPLSQALPDGQSC